MLVLTRKVGEQVIIGKDIRVQVVSVQGNKVRLGFTAPSSVAIVREEIAIDCDIFRTEAPDRCALVPQATN